MRDNDEESLQNMGNDLQHGYLLYEFYFLSGDTQLHKHT